MVREEIHLTRNVNNLPVSRSQKHSFIVSSQVVCVAFVLGMSVLLALWLRYHVFRYDAGYIEVSYLQLGIGIIFGWILVFTIYGRYNHKKIFGDLKDYSQIFNAVTMGVILTVVIVFIMGSTLTVSPSWLVIAWGLAIFLVILERLGMQLMRRLRRGSAYVLAASQAFPQQAVVWDSVDCISQLFEQASHSSQGGFRRWATRLDLPRTRRSEGRMARLFDRVMVTAENDRATLQKLAGEPLHPEHITVLPNGVDLDYFSPGAWPRQADEVIFSGNLSKNTNNDAAIHLINEVMPRVWLQRPQVRLRLIGKDPSPFLRSLAGSDPRIEVTGTVPDLGEHLRRAAVAVAPLTHGVNIQNKVLEAMACATPVIAYPQAGLALEENGQAAYVVQGPEAMANGILRLLADPDLAEQIGWAGRYYVEQHHDWAQIAGQLEEIYSQALERKNG